VALVRTDVSEEPGASFIRVTKIGELGTTQAATSNRRTLQLVLFLVHRFLSPWWRRQVPPKRRFLQEPHGVTTQKTPLLRIPSTVLANRGVFVFRKRPLRKIFQTFPVLDALNVIVMNAAVFLDIMRCNLYVKPRFGQ
jgi:hypothetical protein